MLNSVVIQGRIGTDIEPSTMASGSMVATIPIAVDRDFKGESGERATDWFDVVFFGKKAEFLQKYFTKGAQIIIRGRLQKRRWEDRDGNRRTAVEIVAEDIYFAGNSNNRTSADSDDGDLDGFFG